MRDFDPAYVTHLILDEARGDKFDYVQRSREKFAARRGVNSGGEQNEWVERLKVVTSKWVEDCWRERQRVSESDYVVHPTPVEEKGTKNGLPKEVQNATLQEACTWMIQREIRRIFTSHSFLLVGFDGQEGDEMNLLKQTMSKLIRRGGGTIYWHPNDVISVVVLSNACSEDQWYVLYSVFSYYCIEFI